jgi:predicted TIM-barrel fold metal-dependent hydrolase
MSGAVSERILGYQPWIHEDPALTGLDARWRVMGAPLDQPRFTPVFETAARHGGALWIHPTRSPAWPDYPAESRSEYGIWWSLGWPYETSVCMARLVYSGFFDSYPGFFGADHVLFGTDMPLGGPTVVGDTIADIEALGLPAADTAAIFGENARRALRIPA